MIAAMLGHALVATEDPKNFAEAKQVLKAAVSRDNQDPFAWYQLGIIYDREGDPARAALATAERSNLQGEPQDGAGERANGDEGHSGQELRTVFARRTSPWCRGPSSPRKTRNTGTTKTSEQGQRARRRGLAAIVGGIIGALLTAWRC